MNPKKKLLWSLWVNPFDTLLKRLKTRTKPFETALCACAVGTCRVGAKIATSTNFASAPAALNASLGLMAFGI